MDGTLREDAAMKYLTIINNKQFEIEIQRDGSVLVNGARHDVDFLNLGGSLYSVIQDTRSKELAIEGNQADIEVLMEGKLYEVKVLDQRALLMAQRKGGLMAGSGEVHSPMPGLIVEVMVNVGDMVEQGATVVILESMKMQNELKAPRDGRIQTISCQAGQTVEKGTLLVIIAGDDE
jgi:pyruvate carboxylase subunit B